MIGGNEEKLALGHTLAEVDNGMPNSILTDCEAYGMVSGCDENCPVLIAGKCDLQDTDNKELYELAKTSLVMKELTIEQKAQRYDEALKKAKQFHDRYLFAECNGNLVEYIFPEIKESEDERIRKELIRAFKSLNTIKVWNGIERTDILAWLEKQGEPTDINPSEFDLRLNKLLKQFETLTKKELESSLSFYLNVVQNDGTYREEKQGEQKPFDYENATITQKDFASIDPHFGKPIDKVKPKFHEGDWVVCEVTGAVYQIKNCIENLSNHKYGYDLTNGGYICSDAVNHYHPWTIQDAKDGDVLSDGTTIFIFKDLLSDGSVMSYCDYDTDSGESDAFCPLSVNLMCSKITPATKEQRDTLMKAMADAGYTFDLENKELRKIVVPVFNIGDTIIKKHNSDINNFGQFTITDITGGKYWYNDRIICDITKQDEWEIYEPIRQKPAEWSEEDEDVINHLLAICAGAKRYRQFAGCSQDDVAKYQTWLKSIRPQNRWKPSEEQIKALEWQIQNTYAGSWQYKATKDLWEQLKQL